jgi:hypothetical protein
LGNISQNEDQSVWSLKLSIAYRRSASIGDIEIINAAFRKSSPSLQVHPNAKDMLSLHSIQNLSNWAKQREILARYFS